MNNQEKFTTRSRTLKVHRPNSQIISLYPVIFSTDTRLFPSERKFAFSPMFLYCSCQKMLILWFHAVFVYFAPNVPRLVELKWETLDTVHKSNIVVFVCVLFFETKNIYSAPVYIRLCGPISDKKNSPGLFLETRISLFGLRNTPLCKYYAIKFLI